jgi:tRNA pseudouridine32 synthase/23S rRNA pseudouridine746 synthase
MNRMATGACSARDGSMKQVNAPTALALPTRDGVGPSCVALPAGDWRTMGDFLAQQFPAIPHAEWIDRMVRGDVLDAQGRRVLPETPYRAHCKIYYYRSLAQEPPIPFEETVLYRDDYLVVADKPHFLPVVPSGRYLHETLLVRLKHKLGIDTLAPVHRIDRETAGLVLFTIQPHTRGVYQALFRERQVAKRYEAIAPWRADLALPLVYRSRLVEASSFMQMQEAEGEPNTETAIALLERKAAMARYELRPVSGQRHQLRVHMAALGIPIENDAIYPHHLAEQAEHDYAKPLQLLAKSLTFIDPLSGQPRQFESRRALRLE